jgi:hypothetical protein
MRVVMGLNRNKAETTHASSPEFVVFQNQVYLAWVEISAANNIQQIRCVRGSNIFSEGSGAANPSWEFVDGGLQDTGLNKDSSKDGSYPHLVVVDGVLYLSWHEAGGADGATQQVRVVKFDPALLTWAFVDGNGAGGINFDATKNAGFVRLAAWGNHLMAAWHEADDAGVDQIRVKQLSPPNDGSGSNSQTWSFVQHSNSVSGLNRDTSQHARFPTLTIFKGRVYCVWQESNGMNYQVRVRELNYNFKKAIWTFFDGGGANGLNKLVTRSASRPHFTVLNAGTDYAELWLTWTEGQASCTGTDKGSSTFQYPISSQRVCLVAPGRNTIHAASFNNDYVSPTWTHVDTDALMEHTDSPTHNAHNVRMVEFNAKLHLVWSELTDQHVCEKLNLETDKSLRRSPQVYDWMVNKHGEHLSYSWNPSADHLWTDMASTLTCASSGLNSLTIRSNGIPMHDIGRFPMDYPGGTVAAGRADNPNAMKTQKHEWTIPANPTPRYEAQVGPLETVLDEPTALPDVIGFTLGGVPLFNPISIDHADANNPDGEGFVVRDLCGGQPLASGAYGYYADPKCIYADTVGSHSPKLGYALDGYPIYGPLSDGGVVPTDLDECNGRTHPLLGYVYHVTASAPYMVGCFHGHVCDETSCPGSAQHDRNRVRAAQFSPSKFNTKTRKVDPAFWALVDGGLPSSGLNIDNWQNARQPVPIAFENKLFVAWQESDGRTTQIRVSSYDGSIGWKGTLWTPVAWGIPRLLLETGSVDRYAPYHSGSGSRVLVFRYVVQPGDSSSDLDVKSPSALEVHDAKVEYLENHLTVADLTLAAGGSDTRSLAFNENIIIDTSPPTVTDVTSPTPDGTYGAGEHIIIEVTFSDPVVVTGYPTLKLLTSVEDRVTTAARGRRLVERKGMGDVMTEKDCGSQEWHKSNYCRGYYATYFSGSGTNKLSFLYVITTSVSGVSYPNVWGGGRGGYTTPANSYGLTGIAKSGDHSFDLTYDGSGAISHQLNGSAIQRLSTHPTTHAITTLPSIGLPNSLSANKDLVIDTDRPFVIKFWTDSTHGKTEGVGDVVGIYVQFSQPVVVLFENTPRTSSHMIPPTGTPGTVAFQSSPPARVTNCP